MKAVITFKSGERIEFTVDNVIDKDIEEFLSLEGKSPSKVIYDNYLAYVPQLFSFSGHDIKNATLSDITR